MPIELLLKHVGSKSGARLVPVITNQMFQKYWLPACRQLGLQWIPLFETGLPVTKEDIPFIIYELKKLKIVIGNTQLGVQLVCANHMLSRINRLISELQDIRSTRNMEVFIG